VFVKNLCVEVGTQPVTVGGLADLGYRGLFPFEPDGFPLEDDAEELAGDAALGFEASKGVKMGLSMMK